VGGADARGEGREMSATSKDGSRPVLPRGEFVDLPTRGRTFVRECAGPEGAPAVVLLHGWMATAALNWAPSFAPLATNFRVIAIDHRGHGRGLRGHGSFRLEDCADDVAALVQEMGVERCIAVGYSMGGTIAQLLSRRHPTLLDGLVLCATAATFHGTPREVLLSRMATAGSILAGVPLIRPFGCAAMGALRGWGWVRRSSWWGLDEVARHDWTRIVEAGREVCRFDGRSWLPDTSVPTSVIATRDDQVVPYRRQLALARAIPGSTVRTIDGGHSACTSAPQHFVSALVKASVEVAERAARVGGRAPVNAAA
jgi:pimeloyl-ACP methyl ester carboxylesterase